MGKFDITILTDQRYKDPPVRNDYINNVLLEDNLLKEALERKGMKVHRTNWDDPLFDWNITRFAIFRTTWDYFDRYEEFKEWMRKTKLKTRFLNSEALVDWNIDKRYLEELEAKGINIPPTIFIEIGERRSLIKIASQLNWHEFILKPTVSGAGRHTYRFKLHEAEKLENIFRELIKNEEMMLQEFQKNVPTNGEIAFMIFGGKFSHAVLKKAKSGDFRVQDDFGGTVHHYHATESEIHFAEQVIRLIAPTPVYARVDVISDNQGKPAVGEVELIEPELWLRMDEKASNQLAEAIYSVCTS